MSITHLFHGRIKLIGALSCVALLTACGGGGGGDKTSVPSSVVQSSAASVVASSASSLSVSSASSSVTPDVTPDAFSFTTVTGAALSTSITSTAITISGINTAATISIIGGQYAIGGGAPTGNAGTITNGQTVKVTLLTSATAGTTTQAVLTVGGVAGAFSATTANAIGGGLNIATVVTTLAGTAEGADGVGLAARFSLPKGITRVGDNLYVADTSNHTIRKIVISTGVVTTFAGRRSDSNSVDGTGTAASFANPKGITSDGTHLYVTDRNKIRKIVIATGVVTTLAGSASEGSADGTGTAASFNYLSGITSDGTSLYVVDTHNHKIRKIVIATGVVTTLAGSGSEGGTDGTGSAASFNYPVGITSDGTNLYIADTLNSTIRKIVIATGVVTTFAGRKALPGSADGVGTAASFTFPNGIISDGTNLYVADSVNSTIRKIVIATGAVTTVAGMTATPGSTDGTGTAARFRFPFDLASDGTNLYIADNNNNAIRKIVIATGVVTTLAGSGWEFFPDGTGSAAIFGAPTGITSDGRNLYVADTESNKIRKVVIATAVTTTLAGSGSQDDDDGTGMAASFFSPSGITGDGTNLYVSDTNNHKIRKIVIATGVVTTLAGSGFGGGVDGTGTAASFFFPRGIISDGTNLYIADTNNHKIRKIVIATGVVTTLAGSGSIGYADGTGEAATFSHPSGITRDGANLYVADSGNQKIRKIVIATGVVTTLAGGGLGTSADGTGEAASFNHPSGITSDGTNLYITDEHTHKIRKIVMATGVVTTLAGSGSIGYADGTGTAASFFYPAGITTDGFELFVTDSGNSTIRRIH